MSAASPALKSAPIYPESASLPITDSARQARVADQGEGPS
jgi:hypothetical protein